MPKIETINNLTIKVHVRRGDTSVPKYSVWAPDGRLLEMFHRLASARKWARETTDFVRGGKYAVR